MSLPHQSGNGRFGRFLPPVSFAIVALIGNIQSGLWYPVITASMTFVVGAQFVKDTREVDITI